jgi:hypothetical protein
MTFDQLRRFVNAVCSHSTSATPDSEADIITLYPDRDNGLVGVVQELDGNLTIARARDELRMANAIMASSVGLAESQAARKIVLRLRRRLADAIVDACIPVPAP